MQGRNFSAAEEKKMEFRTYMTESGVEKKLTEGLIELYETRPPDALAALQNFLALPSDKDYQQLLEENAQLRAKLKAKVLEQLLEENAQLRAKLKAKVKCTQCKAEH
jgi:hypothetical protein